MFYSGTEYLDSVPEVIGRVRFTGSVANPQREGLPPLCSADLGGKHTYQARGIKVEVDCKPVGGTSA